MFHLNIKSRRCDSNQMEHDLNHGHFESLIQIFGMHDLNHSVKNTHSEFMIRIMSFHDSNNETNFFQKSHFNSKKH